jgi:tetratricopeptide (TPR) repeat protein
VFELAYASSLERRLELADEAVAIAESCGDDATIVRVQSHISDALYVPSLFQQRVIATADALERAERIGDPSLLFHAALNAMGAAGVAGDIDKLDRCLETMGSAAAQLDQPFVNWNLLNLRAGRALLAGECDEAEQLAKTALQIGIDSGQPDATSIFEGQIMYVSWQRGTLGDHIPQMELVMADDPGLTAFLAAAYAEVGQTDNARRLLKEFSAAGFNLPLDLTWLTAMLQYADAAFECRDPQVAERLFDRLAPYADLLSFVEVWGSGPVSRYLGALAAVLGRYDQAHTYFTQAAALSLRLGAKFDAARTSLSWGQILAERNAPGDAEKARDLLTSARTAAASHGYANIERRATKALRLLN